MNKHANFGRHIKFEQVLFIAFTWFSMNIHAASKLTRQDSLTIAKAEEAILKAAAEYTPTAEEDPWGSLIPPHDDFEKLIKSNPKTLDYPFNALQEKEYVHICTSKDGQLRYYSWDTGLGGSMINFSRIEQYRTPDGQVHVNAFTDDEFYTMAREIDMMKDNGAPIYLVRHYFRESTCHCNLSIAAVRIDQTGLHRPKIFEDADSLTDRIGISCNFCDNAYQVQGYEDDFSYFYFDKGNKDLLIAINEDRNNNFNIFTDHYRHYVYDGKVYRMRETVANPHLHPSLQEYEHFHQAFLTKGFRVRIDKMNDGTYRYTSWKRSKKMSEKPDIILQGGAYNKSEQFVFYNEGYTYIVDDVMGSGLDKYLTVKKNEKQVLRQKRIDL